MMMFTRVLDTYDGVIPRGCNDHFQVHLHFVVEGPEPDIL
jgi:hypothetical protein